MLGMVATVVAAIEEPFLDVAIDAVAGDTIVWKALLSAFILAAVTEELMKYWILQRYCTRQSAFDEPMDGMVYGAVASLGFAALENVLYVVGGGWGVAALRAVLSVPGHVSYGAIMGYYVGQARFTPGWPHSARRGLWFAILLHGLFDFPLLANRAWKEQAGGADADAVTAVLILAGAFSAIAVNIVAITWALRLLGRCRRDQQQLAAVPSEPASGAGRTVQKLERR